MGGSGLGFQLSQRLMDWTAVHVSGTDAAIVFLAMPLAVLMVGGVTRIGRCGAMRRCGPMWRARFR
jgi:hypothetical protein